HPADWQRHWTRCGFPGLLPSLPSQCIDPGTRYRNSSASLSYGAKVNLATRIVGIIEEKRTDPRFGPISLTLAMPNSKAKASLLAECEFLKKFDIKLWLQGSLRFKNQRRLRTKLTLSS